MTVVNTLAYYRTATTMSEQSFIVQAPYVLDMLELILIKNRLAIII
jgi:hypothetical protein